MNGIPVLFRSVTCKCIQRAGEFGRRKKSRQRGQCGPVAAPLTGEKSGRQSFDLSPGRSPTIG